MGALGVEFGEPVADAGAHGGGGGPVGDFFQGGDLGVLGDVEFADEGGQGGGLGVAAGGGLGVDRGPLGGEEFGAAGGEQAGFQEDAGEGRGIRRDRPRSAQPDVHDLPAPCSFVTPGPPVTTASNPVKHGTLRGPAAPWAASRHSFSSEEHLPL
jgi:hypothetical protein